MNKQKIIVSIAGAMLVAGLGAGVAFAPEAVDKVLVSISTLITAIVALLNGANNNV